MKKKIKGKVLAEGEVTGHSHRATAPSAEVWDEGGAVTLSAPKGTDVVHEEHGRITLPPGEYDRLIVQEYDPFAEEARRVVD